MRYFTSKIFKHKLFKISTTIIIVLLLTSSISLVADDDIKSATNNFSAMGIVSEISEDGLSISEAKGSDGSGKTSFDLNIDNLEKMETNTNISLNFSDIKEGDKIIVQGLTNGSTFFVKRIISFTSTPTPVVPEESVATSTATTTEEVSISTSSTTEIVEENFSSSTATTTEEEIISTSTNEEVVSTTTSTTTPAIVEDVVEVVETITETITEVVENIVETITTPESMTPVVTE